ncbi:MAG: SIS domain-containing protein [Tetragenococcus koreensis]|nr:SIS domain-containing protein [Tetragenococcus koreensis]
MNYQTEFNNRITALQNASDTKIEQMEQIAEILTKALKNGNKILTAGNGGSAANAQHITGDVVGRYKIERKAFAGVTLSVDPSVMTATGNDYGYEEVFARQVEGIGNKGDILIVMSSSAASPNLLQALKKAREMDICTVAVLGNNGGSLKEWTDDCIDFPFKGSDLVEEIAMSIFHIVLMQVEENLVNNKKKFKEETQMKILTVCGMGSGSSLILKMNIDSILEEENIKGDVEACDLGSVGGNTADLIVSTAELESQLSDVDVDKVFVNNVVDKDAIKDAVLPKLKS